MAVENEQRAQEIRARLAILEEEKKTLLQELNGISYRPPIQIASISPRGPFASEKSLTSSEQRLELFQELFCCRTDVFPKFWKSAKTSAEGYSPACKNEWAKGLCAKSKVKCSDCSNRCFIPLDQSVIREHLEGKITIGTYAIRMDDTCIFLAADFDEENWREDVFAYKKAGEDLGIEISIERSRSGNGAHAWIFFSDAIPARDARQLGTHIISRAMSDRHNMAMKSYDRFFPCQDTIPGKGFGNLIALPLQREPRRS
jgi:hypothetical protein